MASNPSENFSFKDETKLGDCAAQQPLSGVGIVLQSGAVNGRGGFVLKQTAENVQEKPAA